MTYEVKISPELIARAEDLILPKHNVFLKNLIQQAEKEKDEKLKLAAIKRQEELNLRKAKYTYD